MGTEYKKFIDMKTHIGGDFGINVEKENDRLFDFQKHLVEWSLKKGRCAIFADCGMGKTAMQLSWAENVVINTNKHVLILAPLAVSTQTKHEAEKFGIDAVISRDGSLPKSATVIISNYERLHYFNWKDFSGCVCDESSILKNYDGAIKSQITTFMTKLPFRLLCTATAAPNDYIELGTSSEALGYLGYIDMLKMFFKSNNNTFAQGGKGAGRFSGSKSFDGKFVFRGHSEENFWRWVCSWARAIRKPSDIGFSNDGFKMPNLNISTTVIQSSIANPEYLFDMPAIGLSEQRAERRRSLPDRCESAAEIVNKRSDPSICWCHLNDEGDLLEKTINGAVQVSGKDSDERKEEVFDSFVSGDIKVLVSKPVIAGFGLNLQHCAHQTFFPTHSYEQWYQCIRRSWRYGQKNDVQIDVVTSEGEADILKNLQRKAAAADEMFGRLVDHMSNELNIRKENNYTNKEEVPSWL